jgi:hypothetical protein
VELVHVAVAHDAPSVEVIETGQVAQLSGAKILPALLAEPIRGSGSVEVLGSGNYL